MKKKNYCYLGLGVLFLGLWVIDILSFFKIAEVWEIARGIYGFAGWFLGIAMIVEAMPTESTDKDNETRRNCDMCGNKIMKDEDSTHFLKENSDTRDYCEKCSKKIIK